VTWTHPAAAEYYVKLFSGLNQLFNVSVRIVVKILWIASHIPTVAIRPVIDITPESGYIWLPCRYCVRYYLVNRLHVIRIVYRFELFRQLCQ
jgi:hypothetical protein